MKNIVYQNKRYIIISFGSLLIVGIVIVIFGLINDFWDKEFLIIISVYFSFVIFVFLLFLPFAMIKITIDYDGVKKSLFKKELLKISWSEISIIEKTTHNIMKSICINHGRNKRFYFEYLKTAKSALIYYCSNESLKEKISLI